MILGNLGQLWAVGVFFIFIVLMVLSFKALKKKEISYENVDFDKKISSRIKRAWHSKDKRFALISFILSFLVLFVISFLSLTSSPLFCTKICHSMEPVTKGWKESSHSSIACVNCHIESNGVIAFVLHKMAAYKEPYFELTGKYKEGINHGSHIAEEMPDEHCTVCHSKERKVTSSKELKVSNSTHEAHEKTDTKCAFCHNRVGHETEDHESHMSMDWCLEECHSGEAFIIECNVCHSDYFVSLLSEEKIADIEKGIEELGSSEEEHEEEGFH
jgi:Zn finger protein HypA/HybF involved in hydrogenase expression